MPPADSLPQLETILDYLKENRGCDLTGYKRASLMRRFEHRMQTLKVESYDDYLTYLQGHPIEYRKLLNDVLINHTGFFRDREVWDYLAAEIIPKIVAAKTPDEPIKVWSAGCAAGQEIFSLLMLLAEAMGVEACLNRVQGFATDLDKDVLCQARQGFFSNLQVADIPAALLNKYFEPQTHGGYIFQPSLRRRIVFGHHNLVQDAPMSKIDLLLCRNVLIYFNPDTQATVLARFHFALKPFGFLVLGKTESILKQRSILVPVNATRRVFAKRDQLSLADHLAIYPRSRRKTISLTPNTRLQAFWQTAFEASPAPQLAVDYNGFLIQANEQASDLFNLTLQDWQEPFQKSKLGSLLSAQSPLDNFHISRSPIHLHHFEWGQAAQCRVF